MIKALSQALALKREEAQEIVLRYRARKAVKQIREICYLFGADLSHLEDDIVILAIAKLGKTLEGCNSNEAAKLIGHPAFVVKSISDLWKGITAGMVDMAAAMRKVYSSMTELARVLHIMTNQLGINLTKHSGGRLP